MCIRDRFCTNHLPLPPKLAVGPHADSVVNGGTLHSNPFPSLPNPPCNTYQTSIEMIESAVREAFESMCLVGGTGLDQGVYYSTTALTP